MHWMSLTVCQDLHLSMHSFTMKRNCVTHSSVSSNRVRSLNGPSIPAIAV